MLRTLAIPLLFMSAMLTPQVVFAPPAGAEGLGGPPLAAEAPGWTGASRVAHAEVERIIGRDGPAQYVVNRVRLVYDPESTTKARVFCGSVHAKGKWFAFMAAVPLTNLDVERPVAVVAPVVGDLNMARQQVYAKFCLNLPATDGPTVRW